MGTDTLAIPDPDVLAAGGGAAMRRASSTSSAYSDGSSPGLERPSLSRASSIAYSDDGSATPYRSHSASASVEGIDLLGSSNGALPLSGKLSSLTLSHHSSS